MAFNGTKVICHICDNDIYFDCEEHSGSKEVCLQISAACNVLVAHAIRMGVKPKQYTQARVHLEVLKPSEASKEVFESVMAFIRELEEAYPNNIKIYKA